MKAVGTIVLFTVILLSSFLISSVSAAPPPIKRPMEIIEATIEGGGPSTVDPAACYDTASAGLIQNVYDTLLVFDGERLDRYLPQLATEWTIENITGVVSPEGLPWYYRYIFRVRDGVPFHDPAYDYVTPADVEYCIERAMVMDFNSGPQWMFYEPLLNTWGVLGLNTTNLDGDSVEQARVGSMIDNSVESNSTHVWFNLAFPGAYPPFLQILTQTWASIYSRAWAIDLDRVTNWDGSWSDWYSHRDPAIPPFDDPTPVMMGTGPFTFANLDMVLMYWDVNRFTLYWRGWPLDWPASGSCRPRGYIDHYMVTWAYDWTTRSMMFLNGDVDYCSVPRQCASQVLGQPGVRCIPLCPYLSCDTLFFNFDVDPTTPYGTIFDYGILGQNGIPRDFFADIDVRKAFARLIDFQSLIDQAYQEATQPTTAIIPGLPYYDPSIPKYTYDPANATLHFQQAWGGQLWNTGFTIQLVYNQGNTIRQILCNMLETNIENLNPNFMVTVTQLSPWSEYGDARNGRQLTIFDLGWLADYPDPHNFAYGFYYSPGAFAWLASYADPTMDALIELGIRTPDGQERAQIYHDIQQRVIDTCPSVALFQSTGRHFERDWIVGWYYNPVCYGNYPANCWKWYYLPQSLQDTTTTSNLPADLNYDGKVNIYDIAITATRFRVLAWPSIDSRWLFRCDFNNDRKIDGRDIAYVARYFGQTSPAWAPP